ncbi:MAG TPA: chemotaxis protein CheX [Bryobacteraceae bacterium]|nr:chemotaxis protein CheX [Bryobacteraceae bacterium]
MIDRVTSEEIAAAVRAASADVFATMLQLPLVIEPFRNETREPESFDGVVALVGIAGAWTGTGRVACSPHFACRVAGALLMTHYEAVNEEVLDATAEVANMIIGNVKTIFEETLGPLGLSVPTVIFGRNYRTHSSGVPKWTVVPFSTEGEGWKISFCLMPAKVHAHPGSRPGALRMA